MREHVSHPLHRLFYPDGVAVIGASRNPRKFGHVQVANLLRAGYKGRIYPVNPKADEILGLKCYPSILDVPGRVDVAIVSIPAPKVPGVVKECVEKGVKFVVIISSGFSETGPEGAKLQEAMLEAVKETETRIVGPNTTGILNAKTGFTTTFVPIGGPVKTGPASFIVQTGLFAGVFLLHILTAERFGICKVAGLGNKCDLDESDALEYLALDPETKVIALYLEGIKDGRRFMRVARDAASEKPVLILKSGRTEAGRKAALSHTGSMAGRDEVFDAACRQCGLIRVYSFEEMLDLTKAFAMQPIPAGKKVGIASYSGAGYVLASDECVLRGLELAELEEESLAELAKALPSWAKPGHPVDVEPLYETVGNRACELALRILARDKNVDAIMINVMALSKEFKDTPFYTGPEKYVEYFSVLKKEAPHKPVSICVSGDKEAVEEIVEALENAGFPTYPSIWRAVRALSALYKYAQIKKRLRPEPGP